MNKFFRYLDNKNICYQVVTFGSSYFTNADPLKFDGCQITFDYEAINRQDNARKYELIKRYCQRYNYTIICHYGNMWGHTVRIMKAEDKARLDFYDLFEKKCRAACEKTIHLYNTMGLDYNGLNDTLAGIMEYWGEEYADALRIKTA